MIQLTGNHLSRYFRGQQICSHEINLPPAEIAILLSETASNDATNPRSRILVISWDDPGRGTAPAYREALRSYGGSICPSISHGRCIGRALKDADWPKLLGRTLEVVHTDVFDLVTFVMQDSPQNTKSA